jgi:O-antigen/teichoic acid export membrane protein
LGFARRTGQIIAITSTVTAGLACLIIALADDLIPADRQTVLYLAFLIVPVFGVSASRAAVALGLSWISMATFPNNVFRPALFLSLIAGTWYLSGSLSAVKAMALQLFAVSVMTIGQWVLLSRGLKKTFPDTTMAYETPTWIRTALPLLIVTLLTNFFIELNVVVAGFYLGAEQLAIFSSGFRIAALITFGIAAVDTIMMPRVSKFHAASDIVALQRTVTHSARLRLWGSLAVGVLLVFAGKPILSIFGEEFVVGYEALLILTAAQIIAAVFGPAARLLSVTGYQDQCLLVSAVSLIALFVFHPLFISSWGMNGAAWAVFLVVLLQSVWFYAIAVRHLNVHSLAFFIRAKQLPG